MSADEPEGKPKRYEISIVVARKKKDIVKNIEQQRAMARGRHVRDRRKPLWRPGTAMPLEYSGRECALVVQLSRLHPRAKYLAIYIDDFGDLVVDGDADTN